MTKTIEHMLQNVTVIQKKYNDIAKITGENFNIFSILKMDSKEVRTHSAFIGELLNPKGSHGLKSKPLEIFIKLLKSKFSQKDSNEIKNKFILDIDTITTSVEKYIGFTNDDKTEGGRIDILIEDKNKKAIIIENKIYAFEQTNQLIRYNNYSKEAPILYLTLEGAAPTSHGDLLVNRHYFNISYKEDIKEWLELCLKEAVEFPMLREVIKQYINLIKKLTNQSISDEMNKEIEKLIANDYETAVTLVNAFNNYRNEGIKKLKNIFEAIDFESLKLEGVEIATSAPASLGEHSDVFVVNIHIDSYHIPFEVAFEGDTFASYPNDSIPLLKENNILYAKHPLESEATIIANIVSERIIAIINIIKKQNPNLMQPILN